MIIDTVKMIHMGVTDMDKAKAFYVDTLGCTATSDYGQDDKRWVSLSLPGGGTALNLTTFLENLKPGTMKIYFSTSDLQASYKALQEKGVALASEITEEGWGTYFRLADPDGSTIMIVQS
ncbi:MAG: VOC family protein [Candidatus Saccharibacteria bacterium]